MNTDSNGTPSYLRRLLLPAVWRKAAPIGLVVGVIQICINQGDHWLNHQITAGIVIKTILCPLVSLGVAVASAAATHNENKNHLTEL
jgi:hypothetical protein